MKLVNYRDGDNDPFPSDSDNAINGDQSSAHGTGVAGILVGNTYTSPKGKRYQGIIQDSLLYNLRTNRLFEDQTVELPVVIEPLPEGRGFAAHLGAPFNLSAEAATAEEAHHRVAALLHRRIQQGLEIRALNVPVAAERGPVNAGSVRRCRGRAGA